MISLVVPFYNEADRFSLFEDGYAGYSNPNKLIREIIVVNDGSTDGTLLKLEKLKDNYKQIEIKILNIQPNKGKGHAIKEGINIASQDWILCNDADLSYKMEQIDEWYENNLLDLSRDNTVYFGSRELGMKNNQVKFFWHRRIIGRIYALLIHLLLGIDITDTQCGFKLYQSSVAKKIFSTVYEERFAFDVEVHFLLKKNKVNIQLLPVNCIDVEGSKVNLVRDSWNMFKALFRIKKRHQ